jgi:hypothetical protein
MKANRETLEDQLEKSETELKGLKCYIKELNSKAAELGTDRAQFEEELHEAEHNVKYYEDEVARVKKEIGGLDKATRTGNGPDTVLPHTVKQGIGTFILSAISFVAGGFLGSKLKARKGGKETRED